MILQATPDRTAMTFGNATGQSGMISAVLNSCASRVKAMKGEWDIQLDTTFVKIFEEDILVRVMTNVVDWICSC